MSKESPKTTKKTSTKTSSAKEAKPKSAPKSTKKTEEPVSVSPEKKVESNQVPAAPAKKAKKSPNKLMLVAGLALLVIVGVVCYVLFSGPTKEDYKKAHEEISQVRTDYNAVGKTVSAMGNSISYSSGSLKSDDLQEKIDAYNTSVNELKGLKALRDKEVKEKYDAFTKKNENFKVYVDNFIGSIDDLSKISKSCKNSGGTAGINFSNPDTIMSSYDKNTKSCIEALKGLKESKIKSLSTFSEKMINVMEDLRAALSDVVDAVKAGDRTKAVQLNTQLLKKSIETRTVATDFMSDIKKEANDNDVKNELNDLGKLITAKANGEK